VRLNNKLVWFVACVGLMAGACAGDEAPPPPQQPVTPPPEETAATDAAAQAAAQVAEAAAEQQRETATELVREVFSFRGSGRDPYISLLRSGDVRPLLEDLRVTAITFNPRYPSASVAVLRDTTVQQRYTVRVGDELGRLRIAAIRESEVMVIIEEFGVERQRILRMRRRQEEQP